VAVIWTVLGLLAGADPARIPACESVTVTVEDRTGHALAGRVGKIACDRTRRLLAIFGPRARGEVRVRILADMDSWRTVSRRPWYLAAALVGEEIVTQPPGSLRRIENLESVIAHEIVHLMIRRTTGRACPRWLEEGLAQWLSGQKAGLQDVPTGEMPADAAAIDALELRLRTPGSSRKRLERDYAICLALTDRLIRQVGTKRLVRALPGLRRVSHPLDLELEGKRLRERLFP
jgi:hypothetical protein